MHLNDDDEHFRRQQREEQARLDRERRQMELREEKEREAQARRAQEQEAARIAEQKAADRRALVFRDAEVVNIDTGRTEEIQHTPSPAVNPDDHTPRAKRSLVAGLALVVGLAALGVGGKAVMDTQQLRADITAEFGDVDDSLAGLTAQDNLLTETLSTLGSVVDNNTAAFQAAGIPAIKAQLSALEAEIAVIVDSLEGAAARQDLQAITTDFENMKSSVETLQKRLSAKPTPNTRKASSQPVAAAPRIYPNLEGLEFVHAESWAGTLNAVMRDPATGAFISVPLTDKVRGWTLLGLDNQNTQALFTRGNERRYVAQRSQ